MMKREQRKRRSMKTRPLLRTPRKKLEKQLRESEEKYRAIVENSPNLVAIVQDGSLKYVNKAGSERSGYTLEELTSPTFNFIEKLVAEKSRKQAKQNLSKRIRGEKIQPYEIILKMRDDSEFPAILYGAKIIYQGRPADEITLVDITERKQAEDALRKSQEQYKMLLEASMDAISVNVGTKLVYVNKRCAELLGVSDPSQLVGQDFLEFVASEDREMVKVRSLGREIGEPMPALYEFMIQRKNGTRIPVETHAIAIEYEGKRATLSFRRDITERKRAEEAASRLAAIVESSNDAIISKTLDGIITYWNKGAERLYGYSAMEMKGKPISILVPSNRANELTEVLERIRNGRSVESYETERIRKDGLRLNISLTVSPIQSLDGKIVGASTIARDITDRKLIEDELRATRDRLKFLVSSTPVVIYTCKPYGDYAATFVSQNVTSQLGYTPEEFTKDPKFWVNHLHPDDKQHVLDGLGSLFRKGYHIHEYRLQHKDGTYRRIQDEMNLIRDEAGNPVEVVGYRVDVTRRYMRDAGRRKYGLSVWKRTEYLEDLVQERTRELSKSEERYRTLLETSADAVSVVVDFKLAYVNKRYAEMLGFNDPSELLGRDPLDFIFPDDREMARSIVLRRVRGEPAPHLYEFRVQRKDGAIVPMEVHGTLIEYDGKIGTLGFRRDITERKKMEERLAESQRLVAIGETAAMVAHDLRNPLQGIVGAAYNIREHLQNAGDPSMKEMLAIIDKGVEYANGIISDLLEFSREMPLQLLPTTLRSIVRQALMDVKVPDNIRVGDTSAVVTEILVDEAKIRRVLANLIQNAIDAMPEGGRLSISSMSSPREVSISVTDTGMGIPQDHMKKIWTALYTTKAKGIGLGLPICKRIVEAHGGSISVVSTVGRGSTFTVKFPIRPGEGGERR
jgi:two-component system sporulation sensor kinase A